MATNVMMTDGRSEPELRLFYKRDGSVVLQERRTDFDRVQMKVFERWEDKPIPVVVEWREPPKEKKE